jgi:hypothetical protein
MLNNSQLKNFSYESLVLLIRYGELSFEEIDQVDRLSAHRPAHEKTLFNLIEKHKREETLC